MPRNEKIAGLQGELLSMQEKLNTISDYDARFKEDFSDWDESRNYDLVILSDIIPDYYTCLEGEKGFSVIQRFPGRPAAINANSPADRPIPIPADQIPSTQ